MRLRMRSGALPNYPMPPIRGESETHGMSEEVDTIKKLDSVSV